MSFGMIWFMHKISIFILALVFSSSTFAGENTRRDSDWKFKLGDSTNAAAADFDDAVWQAVSLGFEISRRFK
jgi:hypothetical protein